MARIDDFIPEVAMNALGCPDPMMEKAVINSLREFCKESLYWAADADPIDVEAGVHTYELESPESDSLVSGILMIAYDGKPLVPTSEDLLDLQWPSFQQKYNRNFNSSASTPWRHVVSSIPAAYYQPTSRTVRLVGIPETSLAGGLTMKVGLIPTIDADEVGDIIYEDYSEAISYGALYRLLIQPKKEWTNREGAAAYKLLFDQAMSEAKTKRLSGFTRQDHVALRTTPYW